MEQYLEIFPKLINDDSFYFEVVEDNELPSNRHAQYDLQHNCILIKQSVYDGACDGNGRDRMTIVHETAHVLLLKVNGIKLYRSFNDKEPKPYEDPEWHAKCLAGEIMMPYNSILQLSVDEIKDKCGVSEAAANYHYKIIKNSNSAKSLF